MSGHSHVTWVPPCFSLTFSGFHRHCDWCMWELQHLVCHVQLPWQREVGVQGQKQCAQTSGWPANPFTNRGWAKVSGDWTKAKRSLQLRHARASLLWICLWGLSWVVRSWCLALFGQDFGRILVIVWSGSGTVVVWCHAAAVWPMLRMNMVGNFNRGVNIGSQWVCGGHLFNGQARWENAAGIRMEHRNGCHLNADQGRPNDDPISEWVDGRGSGNDMVARLTRKSGPDRMWPLV